MACHSTSSKEPTATSSAYYCPMCPGVESDEPGTCPMCGMALERFLTAPAATQWTCPMHPEVVQDKPGPCPICGMALEPMEPTANEEDNAELRGKMHGGMHGRRGMHKHHEGGGMHGKMHGGKHGAGEMMGKHSMVAATTSVEDIDGGARIVLTPKKPEHLEQLRAHVRHKAERMAAGECP